MRHLTLPDAQIAMEHSSPQFLPQDSCGPSQPLTILYERQHWLNFIARWSLEQNPFTPREFLM